MAKERFSSRGPSSRVPSSFSKIQHPGPPLAQPFTERGVEKLVGLPRYGGGNELSPGGNFIGKGSEQERPTKVRVVEVLL